MPNNQPAAKSPIGESFVEIRYFDPCGAGLEG